MRRRFAGNMIIAGGETQNVQLDVDDVSVPTAEGASNQVLSGSGSKIPVKKGVYDFSFLSTDTTANGVYIDAEQGAIWRKSANNGILRVQAEPVVESTLSANQTNRDEVTVTGASWTTNQYAGHWAVITTAFNSDDRSQRIKILSNTSNVLTLKYETGVQALSGDDISIVPSTPFVIIDNLELDGDGNGTANLVITYADKVILRNVYSHDCTTSSNAITINSCENVEIYGGQADDCQMALFIYNSENVRVYGFEASNAGFQHTCQLKDCRNAYFVDCTAIGGANNSSTSGFDCRASGLHKAYDCGVIDCNTYDLDGTGAHIRVLATEGSNYGIPTGFVIQSLASRDCDTASKISVGTPASGVTTGVQNFTIDGVLGEDCDAHALKVQGINAAMSNMNVRVRDVHGIRCASRTIDVDDFDDLILDDIYSENPYYSGSAGEHVRLTDSLRTIFNRPHFVINDSSNGATRCVRELTTSDNTEIIDARIDDDQSDLNVDHVFANSGSAAHNRVPLGSNSLADSSFVTTFGSTDNVETATNIADATHAINTSGKYLNKRVWDSTNDRELRASGDQATDDWDVVDGSASVTPA